MTSIYVCSIDLTYEKRNVQFAYFLSQRISPKFNKIMLYFQNLIMLIAFYDVLFIV
jgi:hypothetical protein